MSTFEKMKHITRPVSSITAHNMQQVMSQHKAAIPLPSGVWWKMSFIPKGFSSKTAAGIKQVDE